VTTCRAMFRQESVPVAPPMTHLSAHPATLVRIDTPFPFMHAMKDLTLFGGFALPKQSRTSGVTAVRPHEIRHMVNGEASDEVVALIVNVWATKLTVSVAVCSLALGMDEEAVRLRTTDSFDEDSTPNSREIGPLAVEASYLQMTCSKIDLQFQDFKGR
jgi:hypothetical protein